MIYGYIRVSTDKQSVRNQRFEIETHCLRAGVKVGKWFEETISAARNLEDRKLGRLLNQMKSGDLLIVSELSRLGRNLMQIMSILNMCMKSSIKVIAIKENYELGDNINSKVLAFAFGLTAEIERNLISARTKEALARKKAEGAVLGRPKGSGAKNSKLWRRRGEISKMLQEGVPKAEIAKKLKIHRTTLNRFIRHADFPAT